MTYEFLRYKMAVLKRANTALFLGENIAKVSLPRYFEECSHRVKVSVWWLTFSKFNSRDPERPDVTSDVIRVVKLLLARNHLGIDKTFVCVRSK